MMIHGGWGVKMGTLCGLIGYNPILHDVCEGGWEIFFVPFKKS